MSNDDLEKARREAECSATAWFAVLERARQTNDFETAAKARQELEHLGVTVRYVTARKAVRDGR